MSLTDLEYFHGSPIPDLIKFDSYYANVKSPFGPAIYLTSEIKTATWYRKHDDGVIYRISLCGDTEYTINLNDKYIHQTIVVQNILKQIYSITDLIKFEDLRDLLYSEVSKFKEVNKKLQDNGIWMIYGEIPDDARSGPMDHGVQYAILEVKYAFIDGKVNIE